MKSGKTVEDEGSPGVGPKSGQKLEKLVERIIEAKKEATVIRATAEALGIDFKAERPLATQIVIKAMESQDKALDRMREDTKELTAEVKEANQSIAESQYTLMQDMLKRIEDAQKRVDEAAKVPGPRDAFTRYHQVKEEIEKMVELIQPQGISEATQIKLKELELEQARTLAQITADSAKGSQQFGLLVTVVNEYMAMKRLDRQDNQALRAELMRGLSDIAAVLGEALAKKK